MGVFSIVSLAIIFTSVIVLIICTVYTLKTPAKKIAESKLICVISVGCAVLAVTLAAVSIYQSEVQRSRVETEDSRIAFESAKPVFELQNILDDDSYVRMIKTPTGYQILSEREPRVRDMDFYDLMVACDLKVVNLNPKTAREVEVNVFDALIFRDGLEIIVSIPVSRYYDKVSDYDYINDCYSIKRTNYRMSRLEDRINKGLSLANRRMRCEFYHRIEVTCEDKYGNEYFDSWGTDHWEYDTEDIRSTFSEECKVYADNIETTPQDTEVATDYIEDEYARIARALDIPSE